jgi:hypothetical protein
MSWSVAAALLGLLGAGIEIDAKYPGGNIVVDGIANDVVRLKTDLRDTAGWWFYWNFRIRGAEGKTLRFQFDREPIGLQGPAVSNDAGVTWRWLGPKSGDTRSFTYPFAPDEREVRFAYTIPYLQADWERFLAAQRGQSLQPAVLCKSRHGRDVECLYFGRSEGSRAAAKKPAARVVVTCRHHACESSANYVLEGLIGAVLDPATDETRWLAANVAFLAIPFVDKDGVEEGDQGKNRRPRDHNRDYVGDSVYPETKAIRERVPAWLAAGPAVALDLHCPCIRGDYDTWIYQVGSSIERIASEQQRFVEILARAAQGPLPYRKTSILPFGTAWNTAGNYKAGMSFGRWAAERAEVRLASSFEIPYAQASGVQVNPDSARAFGRDIAAAIAVYLRSPTAAPGSGPDKP